MPRPCQLNGLGQRVHLGGGGGLFVYDEQSHLIGEYNDSTAKMARETVYLGDLPVAVLTQTVSGTAPAQQTATNLFYIYPDHLGRRGHYAVERQQDGLALGPGRSVWPGAAERQPRRAGTVQGALVFIVCGSGSE